ncbi:predicted protein [Naegleria gruberi]|uniref:Predicted protein n=1 Tax=Naegleria gruberi TaxID=5762 RepID=D2VXD1_NAEGR|nr:uncharacterized protein NAEGRDRAFT_53000 [Naegleria gruberi]EFC38486.1 predicted protein [Naegleria gruberi]|eukprot:XP_002671230.1 predicted protein [Naegleria gruberi strain NEG-M]
MVIERCLIYIKRTKQMDSGVIEYQEKVMDFDALNNIPCLITFLKEEKYAIEVQRTTFIHKNDENVILTLDKATFEDDSSFVVFSMIADIESANYNHLFKEIAMIQPCRSIIIELISKVNPQLYNYLIKHGHVKDMDYKSMSEAEFEAGPEEAIERNKLAHSEKERMIKENEELDDEDKYSSEYIRMWFRSVLKYGLFKFKDDDEDNN